MKQLYLLFSAMVMATIGFAQSFPNAGFEFWRTNNTGSGPVFTINAPTQWYGFDSLIIAAGETYAAFIGAGTDWRAQLFQENTVVHSGSSSAKLITVKQDTLGEIPGTMANASVGVNALALIGGASIQDATTFSGGTAVSLRITTVSAWIKYLPGKDSITGLYGGADTAMITVQALSKIHSTDTLVGSVQMQILPSSSFVQITANVVYFDTVHPVDTIRVIFASSGGGTNGALDSSILYVDDISMTGVAQHNIGVKNIAYEEVLKVYPNPSNGLLYLQGVNNATLGYTLTSVSGRQVISTTIKGSKTIDVSSLADGLYFYTVTDEEGSVVQRGKVTIAK